ncbi:MAG: azurin [Pseudomonadota bacterium]
MTFSGTKSAVLLVATLTVMLAGCGSDSGSDESSSAPAAASTEQPTQDTVADVANDAGDAASEVMSDAADAVDDMADTAQDMADDVAGEIKEAASDVSDTVGDAAVQVAGDTAESTGGPCDLAIGVGDTISYSVTSMSAPSSCSDVTVTITHAGNLPAIAMGHNWVLVAESDMDAVVAAGVGQGADGNWVDAEDARVIAATRLVGGGESDSVTFSLSALDAGTNYVFVCTVPGHWSAMKGAFTVG